MEHRHITCSPDLNDWFANQWQGIEQVFRMQPTVRILKTGQTHQEVVYGISSLPMRNAPASRMMQLIRAHWGIENRLHWRRDVTDGEKMPAKHAQGQSQACSPFSTVLS